MTQTLADHKTAARTAAFAARKVAHAAGQRSAPATVTNNFMATTAFRSAAVIAGYRPIRTEIDPTQLMAELHCQGCRLAVPVIVAEATPLVFREWWPGAPMEDGAFGAEIPVNGADLVPDLVIVPLLAFDGAGYRLGYGGGFYDRTLEGLRRSGSVQAVGLAYAAQEVTEVPREPTDQKLDAIVTDTGVIWP
ncbi:MAG: 5-formyltetrahydrofolate cyclo-ligase [Pseudomonadota bacterium]